MSGVRVEGLNAVVRALQQMGLEVDDLKGAFSSVASEGARVAAGFAPKGATRQLSASLRGNRAKSKAVVTAGRASVPYAGPINYGWRARNIAPSGFMQKTDDVMAPKAVQLLEAEINNQIRRKGLQ